MDSIGVVSTASADHGHTNKRRIQNRDGLAPQQQASNALQPSGDTNPMVAVSRTLKILWIAVRLAKSCCNPLALATRYLNGEVISQVQLRNGYSINCAANDSLIVMILEVFNDRCYTGDLPRSSTGVVLDLGANIGVATAGFLLHSPNLRVHAYEPHPLVRDRLVRNLVQNGVTHRVTVYSEAVSHGNGSATLISPGQSMDARVQESGEPQDGTRIETVSLATVFDRVGSETIVMVKVDIEGAESSALEACPPELLARPERYVIEYHDDLSPDAFERCERCLKRAGFTTRRQPLAPLRGYLHAWR